jgi:hypothetical protein
MLVLFIAPELCKITGLPFMLLAKSFALSSDEDQLEYSLGEKSVAFFEPKIYPGGNFAPSQKRHCFVSIHSHGLGDNRIHKPLREPSCGQSSFSQTIFFSTSGRFL